MAVVYSTALPLLKLSAALAKAAGVSFSLSAGIMGVLALAGNRTHKKAKVCGQDGDSSDSIEAEEVYDDSSASDSEGSTACTSDGEVCDSPAVSCPAPPFACTAVEPAAKQPSKPKVHSSWAKLRRAFLASSHGPQQQQQKRQQQHKLLGPQLTLQTTGLRSGSRKGSRDRDVGGLSPTALRYRKFVKGLKSSFSSFSAKNRRKALAESKQSMLRTASSIQSRSIMLTASSTGSTRPAQGAIAAFYLPSKKQTPRRKQGGPWTSNLHP